MTVPHLTPIDDIGRARTELDLAQWRVVDDDHASLSTPGASEHTRRYLQSNPILRHMIAACTRVLRRDGS